MDNLDRMYRHLVRVVRSRFPQHLVQPFTVADLNQTILPYRLHRRELGLETNDDYEITLTELVAGSRDYLIVDDAMRDVLSAALGAVNPDPAAFRQFAMSSVALSPSALRSLDIGLDDGAASGSPLSGRAATPLPTPATTAAPPAAPRAAPAKAASPAAPRASGASAQPRKSAPPPAPAAATPAAMPTPSTTTKTSGGVRVVVPQAGERCRSCTEPLPAGRPITFCPHCGQNVTTLNCPACGSELELGWKFCPSCGRPAATK
jgi:hypothetical protein